MRTRRHAVVSLASALMLSTACSSTQTPVAAEPATPKAVASATPKPSTDPACAMKELRLFLTEIDDYADRGAFEVGSKTRIKEGDVFGWGLALSAIEREADLKLYKVVKDANDSVKDWLSQQPGSFAQRVNAMTIHITASTLALTCRVHQQYAFTRV
ncbi:hypothetical protein ACFXJ8_25845 [Nonomuraea sp. NPDC059194]|uniref:hypothetical protein n=1 Tax=Nonomuraea sp. NPDC059194 TaxID=3346764 RepID=UPI0036BA8448